MHVLEVARHQSLTVTGQHGILKLSTKLIVALIQLVNANFSLAASTTDNSTFTQSVSDGTTITSGVTGSDTSGDFTGLTASTVTSSTVDCPSLLQSAYLKPLVHVLQVATHQHLLLQTVIVQQYFMLSTKLIVALIQQ